ncbi:radical SAM/SPASM family putative metalloenzyme maturase [Rugosimonospora acidiphila]|uniref:Radical SAM/SPASM family putative metalloenzyme maturase n=1 Tax=Rugosimonospora acidiphila TaxID=556531 RepID=A0ABP9RQ56_9ACTN
MPASLTPPLPMALQVEVTSACNLRCAMCLVRYRPPVNKLAGAMPLATLRRLIDDVPGLRRLTLQGLGEPLLAPDLLEMIRYARSRGIRVGFNSNATLLTRDRAEELVEAGLDWLHVSLDGADAPTFEGIREGARFDRVLANLRGLVEAKRAAGSDTPWLRVVFVAMRRNVAQLPDLVALLAGVGVAELRVQNLSHSFADTDPAGAYRQIREYAAEQALWTGADRAVAETAYAAAGRVAREHGIELRLPKAVESTRPGCGWPWDEAYVTSRGVVQPCCMVMGDDRVSMGRLGESGFGEIWMGPAYREFRRRLRDGDPPEVCRGCALYRGVF